MSYSYDPLQLTNDNTNDYYYVRANHSGSGDHHVVSYTYWTTTKKVTVGAMNASIADSNDILSSAARCLVFFAQFAFVPRVGHRRAR